MDDNVLRADDFVVDRTFASDVTLLTEPCSTLADLLKLDSVAPPLVNLVDFLPRFLRFRLYASRLLFALAFVALRLKSSEGLPTN